MKSVRQKVFLLFSVLLFHFSSFPSTTQAQSTLTLDTSMSVAETWTDNLFFTFANKEDDFGTIINARIALDYESKYVIVRGAYAPTGQIFVNNSNANTFNHGSDFDFDLPFLTKRYKRIEVKFDESFNISTQLPAFSANSPRGSGAIRSQGTSGAAGAPLQGAGGGLGGIGGVGGVAGNSLGNQGIFTNRSTTAIQNRAGVRVRYLLTESITPFLNYTNNYNKFTSSGGQDSLSHTLRTGSAYQATARTELNGFYQIQLIEFIGSGSTALQGPGGSGSTTSHSVGMGVHHDLTPTLQVTVNGAATLTETEVSSGQLNFTGGGNISKQFPDGQIALRFTQQIGSGGGLAASTTLSQNAVLTFSKVLTRYISGYADFGYGRNRSLSGATVKTDTYQVRTGVSVAILSWLFGSASYSYVNQDSAGAFGNTAQSNQVFFGLTATAPSWRILK